MKRFALVAALLSSVCTFGCRSPSHERQLGSNTIRLYSPATAFQGKEDAILESVAATMERVSRALDFGNLSGDVAFDSRRAIPGYGVGGYTPNAELVLIWLDPKASDTPDLLSRRLPWIITHELHHALRWRNPGYGSTLLEAMISEGLADHFALQVLGGSAPPWTSALSSQDVASIHERAASAMAAARYDHSEWFFGNGSIPRWAGYTLGFEMVSAYLESHPGSTPAALVSTHAAEFRPRWVPE